QTGEVRRDGDEGALVRVLGQRLHPLGVLDQVGDGELPGEGGARDVVPGLDVGRALVFLAVVLDSLDADRACVAEQPVVDLEVELLAVSLEVGGEGGALADALSSGERKNL